MAKSTPVGMDPEYRTILSRPGVFLLRMLVFLALVGFVAVILNARSGLKQQDGLILTAFKSNPGLNALILGVLVIGIFYFIRQVVRLYPEIRWVNAFRISDPGLAMDLSPTLLAPMATMLRDRRGSLSLSTTAMRTLMDSIGSRLDEARETSRYLIGLLVFLGLLGTFWGLLETISSVGKTISSLDPKAADTANLFEELKSGLSEPLRGMGTAFSASLFGLAGSLILGFLDLQASQAHNRFYNELEEWLSQITELTPGAGADPAGGDLRQAIVEIRRKVEALGADLQSGDGAAVGEAARSLQQLTQGIEQLVQQMRAEQKVVREWVDDQAQQQSDTAALLRQLSDTLSKGR
jgi:hypothetical protein